MELWGIVCEDLGENWPRYNGTTLQQHINYISDTVSGVSGPIYAVILLSIAY